MDLLRGGLLFLVCLLLCFAPGIIGGRFGPGEWYSHSAKSSLTPPGWVFPIAWSILYLLMAIALFLLWRRTGLAGAPVALAIFLTQLVLNGLWSWLFFGQHRPLAALADLALLWVLILLSVVLFWRHRPAAGALLLPYLAWVSFAGFLNYQFWSLSHA